MNCRFLIVLLLSSCIFVYAQEMVLDIKVINKNGKTIPNVQIKLNHKNTHPTYTEGKYHLSLASGYYHLEFSHPKFQDKEIKIQLQKSTVLEVLLHEENQLEEIYITAKEGGGLTSKSIIDRKAMSHLQPSSFADLMEMIPGGLARTPVLTSTRRISMRESSNAPSDYNTSALGTQFIIDGNLYNSNADLQTSANNNQLMEAARRRITSNIGVDMRTISTNDIESVEIIRGIPTAAYGDLTSGVIKIERKIGSTPLSMRFKADGFSKQYYIGKGINLKDNWLLNTSIDFLDAKTNPTNDFTNYQRITASARSKLKLNLLGNPLVWQSNLDFSNNLDSQKSDPDTGYAPTDSYKSKNIKVALANNFNYQLKPEHLFHKIILNTSARIGFEKIEQVQLIQQDGPRAISTSWEQGENVGIFPTLTYISDYYTDGKPVEINTHLEISGQKKKGKFDFQYEVGADWRYSKNNGKGIVYDLLTPPSANMSIRPRAYNNIPAYQILSSYVGNQTSYYFQQHQFRLYTGLRFSSRLGLGNNYIINNKIFAEPRVNFKYSAPEINIFDTPLKADITLGYGVLYKQPTTAMLFPNLRYWDYTQLNYYHNEEQYRYVNFMTYIQNTENPQLTAAKNIKKEIRLDLNYRKHNIFITYFHEEMNNGFRSVLRNAYHTYKQYNAADVDTNNWGDNGPNLDNVSYKTQTDFGSYSITENGSATIKNGIEFGYNSPRISEINTRFTFTGAWFRTQYRNTLPVHYKPSVSLAGIDYPYYGIYKNDSGYINENLNYNLFIDTYIPKLGLTFSASLQGTLYNYQKRDQRIPEPISYYGLDGIVHTFTENDRTDLYKQWLVRNVSNSDNVAVRYTHTIMANLKITKTILSGINTSMFVNRLFNYAHPYNFLGRTIMRKDNNSPYFGMELTYNF